MHLLLYTVLFYMSITTFSWPRSTPLRAPPLKCLALKYAMPARMWKHGIHSFLELLRHQLPHSLKHMLTFICLAYSMMALREFSRSPLF